MFPVDVALKNKLSDDKTQASAQEWPFEMQSVGIINTHFSAICLIPRKRDSTSLNGGIKSMFSGSYDEVHAVPH